MICIKCGHKKTKVTNSRYVQRSIETWRRRECLQCHSLFTTHERVSLDKLEVATDTGVLPFSEAELFLSIVRCLEHITNDKADCAASLTNTVIQKLIKSPHPLSTTLIRETVYATLKHYDRIASVQYAARYSTHLKNYLR